MLRVLLCLVLSVGLSSVSALPLVDKHAGAGVQCAACHAATPGRKPGQDTCLKCHESAEELSQATARLKPNPHRIHLGDLVCTQCHSLHKEQKVNCSACHPARAAKSK